MPKVVSEEEKMLIRQALHQKGIALIKEKGLKRVTVDDIVYAVGIAKGTFYSYYQTKEELLYEIVKNAESKMLDSMLSLRLDGDNFKQNIVKAFKDIYLSPDSIALFIEPEDMEFLMRKLPQIMQERENEKSHNNFKRSADFLGISDTDIMTYSVLSYLMDGLQYIASCKSEYGEVGRQQSMEILINTIADFLDKRRKKND